MQPSPERAARLGIAFRAMQAEDFAFIEALYRSTRREELAATGWPQPQIDAFLTQQHRAQHHHYQAYYPDAERLIVLRDGAEIGRLYRDHRPGDIDIIDIALLPDARGLGIGGAILRDTLDSAGARGQSVSIHVEKMNPARRLYTRLGFRTIEDKGVYDYMRWHAGDAAAPDQKKIAS